MKRQVIVVLINLLLIGGVAMAQEHAGGGSTSGSTSAWGQYEIDDGAMIVSCPAKLSLLEDPSSANNSSGAKNYTYLGTENGSIFVAQYSSFTVNTDDWNAAAKTQFYEAFWKGLAESLEKNSQDKTVLVEAKAVSVSGIPGKEFTFTVGPWKGRVRATLIGYRSYAAAIMTKAETYDDGLTRKFLESFTVRSRKSSE